MPAADLGAAARKEREPVPVTTAFLVYIEPSGKITTTHDLNVPVVPSRAPTHDEVYGCCQVIIKDIQAQQVGVMAAQATMQIQQQVMQQAMGSRIAGAPDVDQVLQDLAKGR